MRLAGLAADRIERGIATLANEADSLDAFRVANRAVARALQTRLTIEAPSWRAFQLAFILLNLPGLADPTATHTARWWTCSSSRRAAGRLRPTWG